MTAASTQTRIVEGTSAHTAKKSTYIDKTASIVYNLLMDDLLANRLSVGKYRSHNSKGAVTVSHINPRTNTRLQIIQVAAKLYIENGYSQTTNKELAFQLDISPGNISFYFPTKEHLLSVLVEELCDFQQLLMEHAAEEGKSSLLAYCLELTSMASACEENEVARDFFISTYSSEMTLRLIRENDTRKTKEIFAPFCPDWSDEMWQATENIVSGIEYATLMTREEDIPLAVQIERTLNTIMTIYGVPKELRRLKIEKVLAMDYRALGRRILTEFREYIEKINEDNLKKAIRERAQRMQGQ